MRSALLLLLLVPDAALRLMLVIAPRLWCRVLRLLAVTCAARAMLFLLVLLLR